jgi:hypothetical protein
VTPVNHKQNEEAGVSKVTWDLKYIGLPDGTSAVWQTRDRDG